MARYIHFPSMEDFSTNHLCYGSDEEELIFDIKLTEYPRAADRQRNLSDENVEAGGVPSLQKLDRIAVASVQDSPVAENQEEINPSDIIVMPSKLDSAQIYLLNESTIKPQTNNWFSRKIGTIFVNHSTSIDYEAIKRTPMLQGTVMYCVIVNGHVINQYSMEIERLPRPLRVLINKKLPTKKLLMVMNMDQKDQIFFDHRRTILPFTKMSSWFKMYETVDCMYFVDESEVVFKPIGNGKEFSAANDEKDQVSPNGLKKCSGNADFTTPGDRPVTVLPINAIDSSPLIVDAIGGGFWPYSSLPPDSIFSADPENPSGFSCSLGALICGLFKK